MSVPVRLAGAAAIDGVARASLLMRAQGLIAQTYDRANTISIAAILTDGTVYYVGVPLLAGDIVANLSVSVEVAGNTVTLSKLGLYDLALNRLALSADQGAAWQSTGIKTVAMIAPYTAPVSGMYYAAIVSKATVTLPILMRGGGVAIGVGPVGTGKAAYSTQAGQTDLPATGTPANVNQGAYWIGVS